jgi:hypothetical protein
MPIHNLIKCSNLSSMYHIDVGSSLKGSTANTKASCIVCTLASGRISFNSPKCGEASALVSMQM